MARAEYSGECLSLEMEASVCVKRILLISGGFSMILWFCLGFELGKDQRPNMC